MSLDAAQQQAVRNQLAQLLAHSSFSGAPRLSSLLRYIVEETLAGRAQQLKEYTLGVAVLGRPGGFDPRLDSIVRVEASKLRARLAEYYKDAGVNDPVLIELPRGSYAPRLLPRAASVDAHKPSGAVAVLPFVNLGPEPDTEYLADGLTEEIIDRLGTIQDMRVVARTSAFQYKDKGGNVQEIGRALAAAHLIEGSVRKSHNRLRVNVRLIDAATGYRVWSDTYDKELDDILSIQSAIADAIAAALAGPQLPPPSSLRNRELSPVAYHLLLRGRFHRNQWTLDGFQKSVTYLEQALTVQPGSAQILAALSEAQMMQVVAGHVPNAQHLSRARAYAEQALALDSNCAQAYVALGWIQHIYDWEWGAGLAAFDRAVQLNPSFAEAWHLRGLFLGLRRRTREGDESFQRALECDPLSLVIHTHRALVPYFAGDLAEAESRVQAALTLEPRFAEAHWVLALIYERQGRYGDAINSMQATLQFGGESPLNLADLAALHARSGTTEQAREITARLEADSPRPHPAASSLARIYFYLGDHTTSQAWLEEAVTSRDIMLPWACADSRYADMWTLPLISDLRKQILSTTV